MSPDKGVSASGYSGTTDSSVAVIDNNDPADYGKRKRPYEPNGNSTGSHDLADNEEADDASSTRRGRRAVGKGKRKV